MAEPIRTPAVIPAIRTVIRAQAGIQDTASSPVGHAIEGIETWIPACAGMTGPA